MNNAYEYIFLCIIHSYLITWGIIPSYYLYLLLFVFIIHIY